MEKKTRLDVYMTEKGLVPTRSKALLLIKAGLVFVNGKEVKKAGFIIEGDANVSISEAEYSPTAFVSRAGLKLYHALKEFGIDVKGKKCLDVGASTGGFTDCLLKNGASKVVAVDVGTEQLHPDIAGDSRVVSVQNQDIREYTNNEKFDFICIDVSFISLTKIFPFIVKLAQTGADVVALIKPQFEAGKKGVIKGVVKSASIRNRSKDRVIDSAKEAGFKVMNMIDSPIEGKEGNKEFLLYLTKL